MGAQCSTSSAQPVGIPRRETRDTTRVEATLKTATEEPPKGVIVIPDAAALARAWRRMRWQLFAASWLSYAGYYACRKVFGVVKSPLRDALGLDDSGVAHLWTAFLVAYMVGQFATAAMSRRISSRVILLCGMSVSVIASVAIAFFVGLGPSGYPWVMAAMVVHGLAQATGWSANVGLVTNWTARSERGRVMALWGTCYLLGAALAKSLAAFLYGWIGLSGAFAGSSLVLGGLTLLFYAWGRESPEAAGVATAPAAGSRTVDSGEHALPDTPGGGASPGAMTTGRFVRFVVAMGLNYFSFKFMRYALDSWSSSILVDHFRLPTDTAGYVSSAFDWVGMLGLFAAGWASDRLFGSRRAPVIFIFTVGMLGATVLLGTVGMSSWVVFGVVLGAMGFLTMGPDSLLSGTGAMDLGGKRRAVLAAGVINGLGSIGPIVQEEVIGWTKTHGSIQSVFWVLGAMAAAATIGTGALWIAGRRQGL